MFKNLNRGNTIHLLCKNEVQKFPVLVKQKHCGIQQIDVVIRKADSPMCVSVVVRGESCSASFGTSFHFPSHRARSISLSRVVRDFLDILPSDKTETSHRAVQDVWSPSLQECSGSPTTLRHVSFSLGSRPLSSRAAMENARDLQRSRLGTSSGIPSGTVQVWWFLLFCLLVFAKYPLPFFTRRLRFY